MQLPGGISTKATEYQEKARKGDNWENEVFSIGSAKPTSNIPKAAEVTRRSPHAHRRVVKDPSAHSTGVGAHAGPLSSSRDSGYENAGALGTNNGAPILNAGHAAPGYNGFNNTGKPSQYATGANEIGLPAEAAAYSRY